MEILVHNNNTEQTLRAMTDQRTWRKNNDNQSSEIIYLNKMLIIALRVVYLIRYYYYFFPADSRHCDNVRVEH